MDSVEERQRDVAGIKNFKQRDPHPLERIARNLRARFALIVVAAFLGLAVWANLGMGAQSGVASNASSKVLAAARSSEQEGADKALQGQEEHGLSPKAEEVISIFGFPITNSMIVSWMVALGVIIFAQAATRNMKQVPEGAQNLLEWLVEGLHKFLEGIIGEHLTKLTFWFFATVFIFILFANWFGLIPGIGAIGWGHASAHGFKIDQPLFRGANADINMTMAMALIFFALWIYWALSEDGVMGFLKELFAPKGESSGLLKIVLTVVFFAIGCLEIVSILFRPVSLSFRLYGNTFAGENMLDTMANLVPGFGWLIPIPFYFLELLVGVVQALVFMLLTAVFTLLICQQEESPKTAH